MCLVFLPSYYFLYYLCPTTWWISIKVPYDAEKYTHSLVILCRKGYKPFSCSFLEISSILYFPISYICPNLREGHKLSYVDFYCLCLLVTVYFSFMNLDGIAFEAFKFDSDICHVCFFQHNVISFFISLMDFCFSFIW